MRLLLDECAWRPGCQVHARLGRSTPYGWKRRALLAVAQHLLDQTQRTLNNVLKMMIRLELEQTLVQNVQQSR